jgi:hypothetical protein
MPKYVPEASYTAEGAAPRTSIRPAGCERFPSRYRQATYGARRHIGSTETFRHLNHHGGGYGPGA